MNGCVLLASELVIWGGFGVSILFIGVAYYALVVVRSARKKLRAMEDHVQSLEKGFDAVNEQLHSVQRSLSTKVGASQLEEQYSAFLAKLLRKKLVVKSRG
ncbi:hypothetical protein HY572_04050 [Candidatus Micrarchaeota archaeon]|nr:hypothetical protein [Candidatus Micrarchaeota archaeon]